MTRFLVFPPLFATWLISLQFGRMVFDYTLTWYSLLRFPTDFYYHQSTPWILLLKFLPTAVAGIISGLIFAALDFALHRHNRLTKETTLLLIPNLLKSGLIAVALVLISHSPIILISTNRRYHAYPPDIQWLNLISYAQIFIVFAALSWAIAKTLKR